LTWKREEGTALEEANSALSNALHSPAPEEVA